MTDWLERQTALIGEGGTQILKTTRAAVIGVGGVGSAAAEALVRAGIGELYIADFDRVAATDRNRQLIATTSAEGCFKTEVAARRYLDINPGLKLTAKNEWLDEHTIGALLEYKPDFIIDAIDKATHKLLLIEAAAQNGIDLISSMGTGKRLDPGRFCIGSIADTAGSADGLARVMRRELKKRGLSGTTVLYSTEPPAGCGSDVIASISFVPPVAGYMLAGYMVRRALAGELLSQRGE